MLDLAALAATEIPSYVGWLVPVVAIGVMVQFFWSSIVSIAIYRMSKTDRNTEKLETRLHETTTKLVDERLRAATHEVKTHVQALVSTLDLLKSRIDGGEEDFRSLGERDQKIELAVASKIDALKDYIRDNAASKNDVKEHERSMNVKLDRVGERIGELSERVAVLEHRDQGARS